MDRFSQDTQNDAGDAFVDANDTSCDIPYSKCEDADCIENELEEFYSYVEAPQIVDNRSMWLHWAREKWSLLKLPPDVPVGAWKALNLRFRRRVLQHLLDSLDLQDTVARTVASHALLYHLQGSFGETETENEQIGLIRENVQIVYELGGLEDIYVACKRACWRHNWLSGLPDFVPEKDTLSDAKLLTPHDKAEYLESMNVEITTHFSQMYTVIEVMRGEFSLGYTLMTLDPPIPVYFFDVIASLREKSIRGFPVKKLILLTWKSLLASIGGYKDHIRCKEGVRTREGLSPKTNFARKAPVSPLDMRQFQMELMAKYPTLAEQQGSGLFAGITISEAMSSLPNHSNGNEQSDEPQLVAEEERIAVAKSATMPPPLKPGRQKFQTDQSKPFVLPFASVKKGKDVPHGIQEATALYCKHLYINTGAWQTWCVRQEYLNEACGSHDASVAKLRHELETLHAQQSPESRLSAEDEMRLAWIEEIYKRLLPSLQSAIIVLLKLVLATTTPMSTSSAFSRLVSEGTPPEQAPSPTLEDVDIMRHREILNKGVSSLLILCLQWFKVSHVLKFEYFAQVLLDSNVILLILKLFGLQEVNHSVRSRCEVHPFGLFEYCRLVGHDNSSCTPQQLLDQISLRVGDVWEQYPNDPQRLRHTDPYTKKYGPFSWRNIATASNFNRVLYQVCKSKLHRILLLVQYKSSAILKRSLPVENKELELCVLKLLKCQIPYCGRKWRQSNMRIITQIYLRCRPDLREDWPGGSDLDAEVDASLPEEQTLRTLIKFYNRSRYRFNAHIAGTDISHAIVQEPLVPAWNDADRDAFERQAFPPRPQSSASNTPGRYISGGAEEGDLDAYEELMQEMNSTLSLSSLDVPEAESTGTNNAVSTNGQNVWEHMSPHEMDVLSRSPRIQATVRSPSFFSSQQNGGTHRLPLSNSPGMKEGRNRVHSSPNGARPTMHWNVEDLVEDAISTEEEPSTAEQNSLDDVLIPQTPLASPKPGGIDEVEHIFGA